MSQYLKAPNPYPLKPIGIVNFDKQCSPIICHAKINGVCARSFPAKVTDRTEHCPLVRYKKNVSSIVSQAHDLCGAPLR